MCWIFHLKKLFLIRIFFVCDRERNVENAEAENGSIRIRDNLVINLFSSKNNLKARRQNCRSYNSLKVVSLKAASSLPRSH